MTSIGRRGLSQAKSSLATKFDGRVTLPLADVLDRVIQLQDQVAELTRIVTVQIDVANQTTELLGRLLATSSSRLEAVEDTLARLAPDEAEARRPQEHPGKTASREGRRQGTCRRARLAALRRGSQDVSAGPVVVDLQALQSPDYRGRGIARYAFELAVAARAPVPGARLPATS